MTKRKTKASLPTTYVPTFLEDLDGRSSLAIEMRKRYLALKADSGADSVQKDLLVRRAIFMSTRLESMESDALEGKGLDAGCYTQAVNSLLGLLKALGLERKVKTTENLQDYIAERTG